MKELRGKKTAMSNGFSENRVLASNWDTEARKQVPWYLVIDRGSSSYLSNVEVYLMDTSSPQCRVMP